MNGQELKALRARARISRAELAKEIEMSEGIVARIEDERRSMPDGHSERVRAALVTINARKAEATRLMVGAA